MTAIFRAPMSTGRGIVHVPIAGAGAPVDSPAAPTSSESVAGRSGSMGQRLDARSRGRPGRASRTTDWPRTGLAATRVVAFGPCPEAPRCSPTTTSSRCSTRRCRPAPRTGACIFEVFGRRLPKDRAYMVNAGTGRVLDLIADFTFGPAELDHLAARRIVSPATLDWLAGYRFTGDIDGYPEGELFFPGSPLMTLTTDFATGVVLETLILSVLNHDVAVASAASRMWVQAGGRPLIEMGSRRTHEESAVAAARAAWIAGFDDDQQRRGRPPATGCRPRARPRTRSPCCTTPSSRRSPPRWQRWAWAPRSWSTPTTRTRASRGRWRSAGPQLGAIRLDSGDLGQLARDARGILDAAGATGTRIVATSDLDEYAIAELADSPVDVYGVGTSVVTGSGSPRRGWCSRSSRSTGGRWPRPRRAGSPASGGASRPRAGSAPTASPRRRSSGRRAARSTPRVSAGASERPLVVALMRSGERVDQGVAGATRALDTPPRSASCPSPGARCTPTGPAIPTIRV